MQPTPNPQTHASTAVVGPQTGASTAVVAVNPNVNVNAFFERGRRPNTFNLTIKAIYTINREIPYERAIEIYHIFRELVRAG